MRISWGLWDDGVACAWVLGFGLGPPKLARLPATSARNHACVASSFPRVGQLDATSRGACPACVRAACSTYPRFIASSSLHVLGCSSHMAGRLFFVRANQRALQVRRQGPGAVSMVACACAGGGSTSVRGSRDCPCRRHELTSSRRPHNTAYICALTMVCQSVVGQVAYATKNRRVLERRREYTDQPA